ncbi:hypothetical protein Tco_1524615 [Tanacetum coccineum]
MIIKIYLHYKVEPRSDKESLKVKITAEVQPVNINEEEEESADDDYELKKGKKEACRGELTVTDPPPSFSTPSSSSPKLKLSTTNRLLSLFKLKPGRFKRYRSFFDELQGRYGYLFEHLKTRFMPRKKFNVLAQHLQEIMEDSFATMVDNRVKELTKTQVLVYVAHGLIMERQQNQADVAKMIADAIQQERKNLRSEISSQINDAITNHIPSQLQHDDLPIWLALKYKFERLHVATTPCRPFTIRPRDQDDSHPEGENSAKRQKTSEHGTFVFGGSLFGQDYESEPGPSTLGNQEQLDDFDFWTDSYATDDDEIPIEKVSQELVDEMSHTVDEAKLCKVVDEMKEILVSPHLQRSTPVVLSCQRDPKAPALFLVNQDLLYLKKGNSGPEKIVLSLHKFPAVIFPDDDIEERTSRWVDKCIKKFNPYARYNIVARRANGSIVSITESDYKNLNKNDIEDMYLLIINNKVNDYAETGLLWSLLVFIRSTVIWERVHDFQLGVESYQ